MENSPNPVEWRCRNCGGLLGVERNGRIHLKHRRAQFVVRGEVLAVCHRCAEINEARSEIVLPGCPTSASQVAFSQQEDLAVGPDSRLS